jgi:hypothetical protein
MLVIALPRQFSRDAILLLSHAGDGAAEVTLVMAQCRCRVMLVMSMLSHAGNGAAEMTWPWRDVAAES